MDQALFTSRLILFYNKKSPATKPLTLFKTS